MDWSALADDAIVAALERRGLTAEDLDELVHEAKSREASSINNGGREDQVAYLRGAGLLAALADLEAAPEQAGSL